MRNTRVSKDYITDSLARERGALTVDRTPWCHIWSSPRVWGIVIAHFAQNWSFYTLLTETPSFLRDILHFNLSENGMLSALPYVMQVLKKCAHKSAVSVHYPTNTGFKISNAFSLLFSGS